MCKSTKLKYVLKCQGVGVNSIFFVKVKDVYFEKRLQFLDLLMISITAEGYEKFITVHALN